MINTSGRQADELERAHIGTFSSVYKAIDLHHNSYDNSDWDRDDIHHRKKVYVALKRIYVTSSPQRILNELELMEDLR